MKNAQFEEAVHSVVVAGLRGHPLDPVYWWSEYIARVPAPRPSSIWLHVRWSVPAPYPLYFCGLGQEVDSVCLALITRVSVAIAFVGGCLLLFPVWSP
jgi:hypothetical protein